MSTANVPFLAFLGGSMSGGEILIILLAMLLLFGSKKLPSMARNLGKSIEAFRRASRNMTDEIMRADLEDETPAVAKHPARNEGSGVPAGSQTPEIAVKPAAQSIGRNEDRPS